MKIPTWVCVFIIGAELVTIGILECYLGFEMINPSLGFIREFLVGMLILIHPWEIADAIDGLE